MPKQLNFLPESDLTLDLPQYSREPLVWFRRLVIWSDSKTVIRSISFRPGLNIIWSPDTTDQQKGQQHGAVGHGSGKTLLCRMLRYCLGENRYTTDEQKSSIALAFPKGMVGAEIMIAGTPWVILRPIGISRQHYAIPELNLEEVVSGDFEQTSLEPLFSNLGQKVLTGEVLSLLPGESSHDAWQTALALLSRDQECRFNSPLELRSITSDSRSPVRSLSLTDILDFLRVAIGAVDPKEFELRSEIRDEDQKHKENLKEIDHLDWRIKRLRKELLSELGLTEEDISPGKIGVKIFQETAKAKIKELDGAEFIDEELLTEQRKKQSDAKDAVQELSSKLVKIEAFIPAVEQHISYLNGELPKLKYKKYEADNPVCPVCEVPINKVLAEGCELSHKLPNCGDIQARWEGRKKEIEDETRRLEGLKGELNEIKANLVNAEKDADEQSKLLLSMEKKERDQRESWYRARRMLDDTNLLGKLYLTKEKTSASSEKQKNVIETKRQLIGQFRQEQANVVSRLSSRFNGVIRECIGAAAKGKVTIDGNGLKLSVQMGGERSTAAIESLKVIALDLAIMCMSMEERTHLPALLIHDSPREADLGLSVYHSLFNFAGKLEKISSKPLFQYIVTTTTRPPEQFLQEPWLAETIRGAPAESRLLKRDL